MINCTQCWKPFKQQSKRGPRPLYCSAACRQKAYRERSEPHINQLTSQRDRYRQALADISPVDLRDIGPHLRCPARCVKGGAELDPFDRTNHHPECPWVQARSTQLQETTREH